MKVHASDEPSLAQRFEGAFLGLAIGDALGYACEFRSRDQILDSFGPEGVTGFVSVHDERWRGGPLIIGKPHPPGTYTDDTQMSLAVAEALVAAVDGDLDHVMEQMSVRFVEWSRSAHNDRAPGSTCMSGCRALGRGVPWRDSGVARSKGAGAPMRAVPIGLRFFRDRDTLLEIARASSLPTHGHHAAIESTAAVALCVAMALEGRSAEEMYREVMSSCAPRSPDLAECLGRLPAYLDVPPGEALREGGLGESWIAEEAVAAALYCYWRSPSDYRRSVLTAANTDGDSDTIACIVGGISGAANGASAIPEGWRVEVENADGLVELAGRLHGLVCSGG